ncbi:WRKY transcription factor 19 [Pyrus ussuriensis x Pyrus communis]|uniref:WRKY transcription factor 19 n=1 Tax=Pyrus ussuriensis x Pyrus communis TaxID=2448454 RepID=A0A5N5GFS0_9ROSA|nr:WRKY transcription factor 19 [Pyrus ussuriensis x Pyrus communis]
MINAMVPNNEQNEAVADEESLLPRRILTVPEESSYVEEMRQRHLEEMRQRRRRLEEMRQQHLEAMRLRRRLQEMRPRHF